MPHSKITGMKTVSLIGAPTDVGASVRGAGMGPDALRVAGLVEALRLHKLNVIDHGNLAGPPNPWAVPSGGLRHLQEVVAWNRSVFDAVAQRAGRRSRAAAHGRRPLPGDRLDQCRRASLPPGEKEPARDLAGRPHRREHRGHQPVAATCTACRSPACWATAPTRWSAGAAQRAAVAPEDIDFIGIRSVDAEEKQAIRLLGLQVFDMRHIDEHGMRNTMTEALHDIDEDTHLHVSFDLDCLDPLEAPGVGTGVRGGPTYREMQLCMEMIADTGRLASLDVVEVNPALDVRNRTAELAVEFVQSLFGASTLVR